jgi:hypothetical protein
MQNQRRYFNIAIVFVWALAHGVWIGAGWHAASETSADASARSGFHCACAQSASKTGAPVASEAATADICSLCQLSVVLPDVPAPQLSVAPEPFVEPAGPLALSVEHRNSFLNRLPPQRGPPAV